MTSDDLSDRVWILRAWSYLSRPPKLILPFAPKRWKVWFVSKSTAKIDYLQVSEPTECFRETSGMVLSERGTKIVGSTIFRL